MGRQRNNDTAFFGHPRGLSTLFFTEMWERFSYFGMRAILLFYMYFSVTKGGLGINQKTAASIMSIYGALIYLSGIIGGWIADRLLGPQRTFFYGGILIMFGHISLALPFGRGALLVSIILIVLGTGLLKTNGSTMVGSLYSENDYRRDAGFSIYLFGVNLGAAIAPWAVPWAANGFGLHLFHGATNYHAGFALAAVGMFIGLVQYRLSCRKYLPEQTLHPDDPIKPEQTRKVATWVIAWILLFAILLAILAFTNRLTIPSVIMLFTVIAVILPVYYFVLMLTSKKVNHLERQRVRAYIPLFLSAMIFWIIDESGSVVLALFAAQRTILHIGSWHFVPANFQTLNPLCMLIFMPLFAAIWGHFKWQPSAPRMFSIALILAGISFAFMALPALIHGTTNGKVSPFWLICSWILVGLGKAFLAPVGQATTTQLAPNAFKSQMMSMYFLADAAGQALNSQIVKFYSSANEVPYFLTIGITGIFFGLILLLCAKRISRAMALDK